MKTGAARFLLALIVAALVTAACSKKPEKLKPPQEDVKAAETAEKPAALAQQLSEVRYTQTKEGKLQWELVAKSVEQALEGPTRLSDVKMTYYSDEGRTVVVTANSGVYGSRRGGVVLRGNVVVTTSDGNQLHSDVLTWNQRTETLKGKGDVTISTGKSVLKGTKFELKPSVETFRIYQVSGVIHREDMRHQEDMNL
jgi:LPS export ABC transporter protein LptC